ncbi:MAG: hypothetical protein K9N23_12830 [Akkermansiaceae bacterium]|nr:hypothetical protein [Akkermansiaceae bacterium]
MTRPVWGPTSDIGAALSAATLSFGTETGGVSNGFESAVQLIEVAEARRPQNNSAVATAASSASALAAGVDIINSLALGNQAAAIDAFYATNVIGSTIEGVVATSSSSDLSGALTATMSSVLTQTVQIGADTSVAAVPEPGRMLCLITGIIILVKRRRH